ncbi:MAG TPA: IS1 family transposase [Cytophagaceae bacterium]|nr:IS1 family transposase [Cytophagaceae bacterium]
MECRYCKKECVKAGKQQNGRQKCYCKSCKKYQQVKYTYKACDLSIEKDIIRHLIRGNGIRDIGYLLSISNTTVILKIRQIADALGSTFKGRQGLTYEMDELCPDYRKNLWVIYAIAKYSREVVDVAVGNRNNECIKPVVDKVLAFDPKRIYTDGYSGYPNLIGKDIHKPDRYLTNRIERMNLTLRTHLKRLCRKTICYTKRADMLLACVKIYFFATQIRRVSIQELMITRT